VAVPAVTVGAAAVLGGGALLRGGLHELQQLVSCDRGTAPELGNGGMQAQLLQAIRESVCHISKGQVLLQTMLPQPNPLAEYNTNVAQALIQVGPAIVHRP
jgi:hypothetical protein